jgi:hypothetical protein
MAMQATSGHEELVAQLTAVRQDLLDYTKYNIHPEVWFSCGKSKLKYTPIAQRFLRAIIIRAGKLLPQLPECVFQESSGWKKEKTDEIRWYGFLLEFNPPETFSQLSFVWTGENYPARKVAPENRSRVFARLPRLDLISISAIDWLLFRLQEGQPDLAGGDKPRCDGTHLKLRASTGEGAKDMPSVDDEDIFILRAMEKNKPRLMTAQQIAGHSHVGEKTVGKRLHELILKNLAIRPSGKNKAASITSLGTALLEKLPSQK